MDNVLFRGRTAKEFSLASLLYDAIEDLNFSFVKFLLEEKHADPNFVLPAKGISPFHLVIGNDDGNFAVEVVKLILQNGGNPNVRSDDDLTPLHLAAAWGRTEIVDLLLASGADPEVRDSMDIIPMQYAIQENHMDIVDLLTFYTFDQDICIEPRKEHSSYSIKFDKIEVNNEKVKEVYELDDMNDMINKAPFASLKELPQTNSIDYVNNWCEAHVLDMKKEDDSCKPYDSVCQTEESDLSETTTYESSDDSVHYNFENRKHRFTKKSNTPKTKPIKVEINAEPIESDAIRCGSLSKESGIMTLPNTPSSEKFMNKIKKEGSSDYITCEDKSVNILERNVFDDSSKIDDVHKYEVTSDFSSSYNSRTSYVNKPDSIISEGADNLSFITVSEVYKHIDESEGVVLLEKHLLKNPSRDLDESIKSSISSLSTILNSNYDSDTLRNELTLRGFNPGPITSSTKRVYLKKLYQLKKHDEVVTVEPAKEVKRTYSDELEKTLHDSNWRSDLSKYKDLENTLFKEFSSPDPNRKWREGISKSSFTYLLLDPRITSNLPSRAENLQPNEIWETFLNAIFYVGKGKRSRPFSHLYEAVSMWKSGKHDSNNEKLQKILDIWKSDGGVVCLHVFQNIIPVEAYTREAAMIKALKLENLKNIKSGDFYGIANTWSSKQKGMLGVFLLYKAMLIFLHEGERQLYPDDL